MDQHLVFSGVARWSNTASSGVKWEYDDLMEEAQVMSHDLQCHMTYKKKHITCTCGHMTYTWDHMIYTWGHMIYTSGHMIHT